MAVVFAPGAWYRHARTASGTDEPRDITAAVLAPSIDVEATTASSRSRDLDPALVVAVVLVSAAALARTWTRRIVAQPARLPAGLHAAELFHRRGPPTLVA